MPWNVLFNWLYTKHCKLGSMEKTINLSDIITQRISMKYCLQCVHFLQSLKFCNNKLAKSDPLFNYKIQTFVSFSTIYCMYHMEIRSTQEICRPLLAFYPHNWNNFKSFSTHYVGKLINVRSRCTHKVLVTFSVRYGCCLLVELNAKNTYKCGLASVVQFWIWTVSKLLPDRVIPSRIQL